MKKLLLYLLIIAGYANAKQSPEYRSMPNISKLKKLRQTRTSISEPKMQTMQQAQMLDEEKERGHVLVLMVEFGGTNTFEWSPGVSKWDPLGRHDHNEWDGSNYGNAEASQFFADYHEITGPTNFTYVGPLHNEIPRPLTSNPTNRHWNAIWVPDFNKSYYENLTFGNGVVFDFNREDGSHFFADHSGISVSNYYAEMSGGKFSLTGDVFGWISLPNSLMYYAADTIPGTLSVSDAVYSNLKNNGEIPDAGDARSLVVDACRAAAELYPQINWADYDLDGDNVIDSLWIIVAGFGQSSGLRYSNDLAPENRIWPHSWSVYPPAEIADGIAVGPYIMNPENSGVYVLAHEYGHALGAIDLYPYQEGTLSPANWAVMHNTQAGFPEGFKPSPMDPYHLDGWDWLNPAVIDDPTAVSTVELYQAGSGINIPAGMHRAARVHLEDQQIDLPVDPPDGKSKCWWGGNSSYNVSSLQLGSRWIDNGNSTLTIQTAYQLEEEKDFMVVMISYYTGSEWSEWEALSNGQTYSGTYEGPFNLPTPFHAFTGTNSNYPDYSTEVFSLNKYRNRSVSILVLYATDGDTQLGGPFIGEISLYLGYGATESWTADAPSDMISDWKTTSGIYLAPHYYYLQWKNTELNGGYDNVLGSSENRFGQSTSGLLVWYINELYSDNEAPSYVTDFPSYGAKGIALAIDAHPTSFLSNRAVFGRPCTNALAAYNNLYQNADATFGLKKKALFPDGESGGLSNRPFFTDARNYCAGLEYTYLNPTSLPPQFEWIAKNFDGSVVTPSKNAYGCRAPKKPENIDVHRVWIDRTGDFATESDSSILAGETGNPIDVGGEYGWNFEVIEEKGTSARVKIWNSKHNGPYPIIIDQFGNGSTSPKDDFLADSGSNVTVQIQADEYHSIDKLILNGTEITAARGETNYQLVVGQVYEACSIYAFFSPDMMDSTVSKQWLADFGIHPTPEALHEDSDGDGLSNEEEFALGTDPSDPSSLLQINEIHYTPQPSITWNSQWGKWYTIEGSTNLIDGFETLLGPLPGDHVLMEEKLPPSPDENMFYRIILSKKPQ